MKKVLDLLKTIFFHFCCISLPILLSAIYWPLAIYSPILKNVDQSKLDILAGIAGSLIGFVITSYAIICSIPKTSDIKILLKNSGKDKMFAITVFLGIIFFVIYLIIWLFLKNAICFGVWFFALGTIETIILGYLTLRVGIDSSRNIIPK